MSGKVDLNKLGLFILGSSVLIHLLATISLATGSLSSFLIPGHRWTFAGCDLWSMVQAGYDLRLGAGIYTSDLFHPALWGPIGFPYVLPPWMAIIIGIPLSFFSPWGAHAIYWVMLECALAALAYLCWRLAGQGFRGILAASLCLIAAPQMVELHHGQTDTFIALGLALLLWGMTNGGKLTRGFGIGLLLAIKPIGMFIIPPLLLKKQRRGLALTAVVIFIFALSAAIFLTVSANPGVIQTQLNVFTELKPGSTALTITVLRPPNDYAFQFVKFLILGRSTPTSHFFPTDQGPMNLLRVIGLPWSYFALLILAVTIYLTWRFRKAGDTELSLGWILLPLWIMPVVWDTYSLLTLPLAAVLAGMRRDYRPLLASLIMVLPSPLGPLPNTVEQTYPLPPDFAPIVIINLAIRAMALGWLTYMAWQQCAVSIRERKAPSA